MTKNNFKYIISFKFNGKTIDEFFKMFYLGKEKINSYIYNNRVLVNGVVVNNLDSVIYENDVLEIVEEYEPIKLSNRRVKVLYEDKNIIVVNKPRKMLVHPDGIDNSTLSNAVLHYLNNRRENIYAYPIHRIDYNTTGIVVFAKDPLTLSYLSVAVEKHQLEKEYVCLCHGVFSNLKGKIECKIGKDRHSNKQIVCESGKEAETYYEVLVKEKYTKLKVLIIHGRKHQIRVHLSSINHPIVGDELYGMNDGEELKLHFKRIKFTHPFKGTKMEISCEEDF